MSDWIRQCELNVGGYTYTGGTTEQTLRFEFEISQQIGGEPGWLDVTVTNVAKAEGKAVSQGTPLGSPVTFQAGYENGLYGQIFSGQLVAVSFGKKNPTDTFLRVQAYDTAPAHNFAVVNKRLGANCTGLDVLNACVQAMSPYGASLGQVPTQALQQLVYPRGVSMFGMAKEYVSSLAESIYSQWNIRNGQLNMIPLNGYMNGPWQINSGTGMVGIPVFTATGLHVRTLINPTMNAGDLVQLNASDIAIGGVSAGTVAEADAETRNLQLALQGYDQGTFKILDITFNGDTRGQPWYMDMNCMVANGNQPVGSLADTPATVPANASNVMQTRH